MRFAYSGQVSPFAYALATSDVDIICRHGFGAPPLRGHPVRPELVDRHMLKLAAGHLWCQGQRPEMQQRSRKFRRLLFGECLFPNLSPFSLACCCFSGCFWSFADRDPQSTKSRDTGLRRILNL